MPNSHVQQYLRSLDLNPDVILQDGWDDEFHEVLAQPNTAFGGHVRLRVPWPEEFDHAMFLKAMREDGLI